MKFCTGACGEHTEARKKLWIGFKEKLQDEVEDFLQNPKSKQQMSARHLCGIKAILGGSAKYLDSDGEERTCLWKLFDERHDIRKELEAFITLEDRQWAMDSLIRLSKVVPTLVYNSLAAHEKTLGPNEVHERLSKMGESVGEQTVEEFLLLVQALKKTGDRFVYLNATYFGGGVATMFAPIIPLLTGLGLPIQWHKLWISDPAFFTTTKRIHNAIQGIVDAPPDWKLFRKISHENELLFETLRKDGKSIFFFDDPQTAGLSMTQKDLAVLHIDTSGTGADSSTNGGTIWEQLSSQWKCAKLFLHQVGNGGAHPLQHSLELVPGIDVLAPKNHFRKTRKTAEDNIRRRGILDDEGREPLFSKDGKQARWMFVGRADPAKGQISCLLSFVEYLLEDPQAVFWFFIQFASDDPEGFKQYFCLKLLIEDRKEYRHDLEIELKKSCQKIGKCSDELIKILRESATMIQQKLSGKSLREHVQIFTNLSDLIGDFGRLANGHLILSVREGYNLIISELALQELPVVATDLKPFRERIISGERGGWLVELPPEMPKLSQTELLEGYLKSNPSILKFLGSIKTKMNFIRMNPEEANRVASELKVWVEEEGNVLQYHVNRLALVLATKDEIRGEKRAKDVAKKVMKRLKHT